MKAALCWIWKFVTMATCSSIRRNFLGERKIFYCCVKNKLSRACRRARYSLLTPAGTQHRASTLNQLHQRYKVYPLVSGRDTPGFNEPARQSRQFQKTWTDDIVRRTFPSEKLPRGVEWNTRLLSRSNEFEFRLKPTFFCFEPKFNWRNVNFVHQDKKSKVQTFMCCSEMLKSLLCIKEHLTRKQATSVLWWAPCPSKGAWWNGGM